MLARSLLALGGSGRSHSPLSRRPGSATARDSSDPFFANVEIPELRIWIEPRQMDRLLAARAKYVCGVLTENNTTPYGPVGVKLKGAAGSYRNWDDRPALTVSMKKFTKKGEFHSLKKFHSTARCKTRPTSTSSSPPIYSSSPAFPHRVTFARVWLNDRDVGFYVLKEGFDEYFLKRNFPNPKGNLYEGPFCADIDRRVGEECGDGPDDRSDLKAVLDATAGQSDAAARRRETEKVVDVNAFATFMAMEKITCHWGGYCQNRNNYRVYFQRQGRVLPAGMDQMFGSPGGDLRRHAPRAWPAPSGPTPSSARPTSIARRRHPRPDRHGIAAGPRRLRPREDPAVLAKMDQGRARPARAGRGAQATPRRAGRLLHVSRSPPSAQLAASSTRTASPCCATGTRSRRRARPSSAKRRATKPLHQQQRSIVLGVVAASRPPRPRRLCPLGRRKEPRGRPQRRPEGEIGIGMSRNGPTAASGRIARRAGGELRVHAERRRRGGVGALLELKAKSGEAWFDADSIKLTHGRCRSLRPATATPPAGASGRRIGDARVQRLSPVRFQSGTHAVEHFEIEIRDRRALRMRDVPAGVERAAPGLPTSSIGYSSRLRGRRRPVRRVEQHRVVEQRAAFVDALHLADHLREGNSVYRVNLPARLAGDRSDVFHSRGVTLVFRRCGGAARNRP